MNNNDKVTPIEPGPVAHIPKLHQTTSIVPKTIDEVLRIATGYSKSGLGGGMSIEKASMLILHGLDVGLKPMQALQWLAEINGRICAWGDAVPAILLTHGCAIEEKPMIRANTVGEVSGYVCTITRPDGRSITRQFTERDAKQAGLWGKNIWAKYPERMLQMRARGLCARDAAPDFLMGLYIAEEVQDYEVKDVTPVEPEPEPQASPLEILLSDPCFEARPDDQPRISIYAYKKAGGGETHTEVLGQINDCEDFDGLNNIVVTYAEEISGMPYGWMSHIRDDMETRWMELENESRDKTAAV